MIRNWLGLATSLAVLALASSCGWKSDGLERLEELYPTPKLMDGGTGPVDIGTPNCSGLDGTWAVRLVQGATISPLGAPWDMTLIDLFLARKSSAGTEMELRFCNQDVTIVASGQATNLGKTEVPAALKTALYDAPLKVPLPGDGTFEASNLAWLWGLENLADPLTDPLPTRDNYLGDPNVVDQDGDSQPGVTMRILSPPGDRYMVRRAVLSFAKGDLSLNNQWLTGALSSRIDESALGATNNLLLTPAPITVNADGTKYQLRCVGQTYTCASLERDHRAVFRDAPQ
ncbi:MAG: hypothetical protein AB1730_27005 [Myxococcota bacterium]|jgi:hypothetical protein